MDGDTFVRVIIGGIGAGMAGEAIRQYRNFKWRRLQKPWRERNAGFWTDRRIIRAEAIVTMLVVALPWTIIIMAVGTNRNLYANYLALIGYPLFIWLIMRGFRTEFADQSPTAKGP